MDTCMVRFLTDHKLKEHLQLQINMDYQQQRLLLELLTRQWQPIKRPQVFEPDKHVRIPWRILTCAFHILIPLCHIIVTFFSSEASPRYNVHTTMEISVLTQSPNEQTINKNGMPHLTIPRSGLQFPPEVKTNIPFSMKKMNLWMQAGFLQYLQNGKHI